MIRATLQAGVLQVVVSVIFNDGDAILLAKPINFPFPAKGRYYACIVALHTLFQCCSQRPVGAKLQDCCHVHILGNRSRAVRIS